MPIIAAVIIVFAALAYAGYFIYTFVATQFGPAMGGGAVAISAAIVIALIAIAVKRYYHLHGKTVNKQRILEEKLVNNSGSIRLEPNQKSGVIQIDQQPALPFIFADIQQVQAQGDKTVQLQLRGTAEPITLNFNEAATAALWVKRLQMAAEQKLWR